MKKILSIIAIIILLISTACADTAMFVVGQNHQLVGIKELKETSIHWPCNVFNTDTYLRGISDSGNAIRLKGMAQINPIGDSWLGLTPYNVDIELFKGYESIVRAIVEQRTTVVKPDALSIINSTLWFDDNYVGHIFYNAATRVIQVGTIEFVNLDYKLELWIGDINQDGQYELGLIPGIYK